MVVPFELFTRLLAGVVATLLLFLLTASSFAAEACQSPTAVELATTSVPPQNVNAMEAFERAAAAFPDNVDILLLGDSLFQNWPKESYPQAFPNKSVLNLALGGSKTQNVLWVLDKLKGNTIHPKSVVLLVGTNHLNDPFEIACPVVTATQEIISRIHAYWPDAHVYLMGVPPRGADFHLGDKDRLAINAANESYAASTDFVHYFGVPDTVLTCGLYDHPEKIPASTTCGLPDQVCPNYRPDFLHFTNGAYYLIADALKQVMK